VRYLAYWDVAPSGSALSASPSLAIGVDSSMRLEGEITPEQVRTVLARLSERKVSQVSKVSKVSRNGPEPLRR
jgi:hypothetical protein